MTKPFVHARAAMVQLIEQRGIRDPAVLHAMGSVPRHVFVPAALRRFAYEDRALEIGGAQTISQPYMVALMTAAACVHAGSRVLEVGTGSGYQAAILARMGAHVYSIEIIPDMAQQARSRLRRLRINNIALRQADAYLGWPEAAPFDAIVVTAAPAAVPGTLLQQLGECGRLVIPLGKDNAVQSLRLIQRFGGQIKSEQLCEARFVPMTSAVPHCRAIGRRL